MEAIARYDFNATEDEELSFRRWNMLKILDRDTDVYWYKAELHGVEGYIPKNYVQLRPCNWFVGKLSRAEAEAALRISVQVNVNFIVRVSESSPDDFSLSVAYGNIVRHLRVNRDYEFGKYYVWTKRFNSLNELIEHYKTSPILAKESICLIDQKESNTARAVFEFVAREEDELSFRPGDLIEVTRTDDYHWWQGQIGDKVGYFPANRVLPFFPSDEE